jgi:hypothetical protein
MTAKQRLFIIFLKDLSLLAFQYLEECWGVSYAHESTGQGTGRISGCLGCTGMDTRSTVIIPEEKLEGISLLYCGNFSRSGFVGQSMLV